jgi:hypothetical protein
MKIDSSDDLFGEIQIMSASELEASSTPEAGSGGEIENDEPGNEPGESEDGLIIAPVTRVAPVITNEEEENDDPAPTADETNLGAKYVAFAKELREAGVLEAEDGELEIKSVDDLKELVLKSLDSRNTKFKESYTNNFSGSKKKFLEIEEAFENEDVAINVAKDLSYYDSIDPDAMTTEQAIELNTKYLKAKGFSDEEIESQLEDNDVLDKSIEKAKKALPWLKSSTNDYIANEKQIKVDKANALENKQKTTVNQILSGIDEREHYIKGLPLNKVTRDKIKSSMQEIVHTDESGNKFTDLGFKQSKNPEEFAVILNYFNSIGLFNQNAKGEFEPDISKFKKVSKTTATKELDKILTADEAGVGVNRSGTDAGTLSRLESIFG